MAIPLQRMERLDARQAWANEATDFTPWLAENLQLVGDVVGLELELEDQEKNVGPFRADLFAKDVLTGNWVLIENQLEKTDHSHLGQLLTYAAGLRAFTCVWIADLFTDEHRAALDWLNEITSEDIQFFGLEIELWKVGELVAPKLNVVCNPNTWTRKVAYNTRLIEGGDKPFSYTRLTILQVLKDAYPEMLSPSEIATKVGATPACVKMSLRKLLQEGLVVLPYRGQYTVPQT